MKSNTVRAVLALIAAAAAGGGAQYLFSGAELAAILERECSASGTRLELVRSSESGIPIAEAIRAARELCDPNAVGTTDRVEVAIVKGE